MASRGAAAGPRTPDTGSEAAPAWGQAPGCGNEPQLVSSPWLLVCPPPAAQGPLAAQPGTSLDVHSHGEAPTPPCSEQGQGTAPSLPAEPCCPCGVAAGGCDRGVPSVQGAAASTSPGAGPHPCPGATPGLVSTHGAGLALRLPSGAPDRLPGVSQPKSAACPGAQGKVAATARAPLPGSH